MSTADELKKLKELFDDGVLTQDEFDLGKQKLLGSTKSTNNDENQLDINDEVEDDNEQLLVNFSPSKKGYFNLLSIGLITSPIMIFEVGLWFFINIIVASVFWAAIEKTSYEITTQRIISKSGLTTLRTEEIPRGAIETVHLSRGPIQRIYNTGSISITGKGISKFQIDSIDDPQKIYDLIKP